MSQESTSSGTPVRDGCPICAGTDRRVAGGLVGWHDRGHNPMQSPERFAVDAAGYVWRVFAGAGLDGGDLWSMAPSNPDNAPIPGPVRYYAPEDVDRDRIVAGTLRSLAEAHDMRGMSLPGGSTIIFRCRCDGDGMSAVDDTFDRMRDSEQRTERLQIELLQLISQNIGAPRRALDEVERRNVLIGKQIQAGAITAGHSHVLALESVLADVRAGRWA